MAVSLTDQVLSLRRFVADEFSAVAVYQERDPAGVDAPAFLIELVQSDSSVATRLGREDTGAWQITYFAPSGPENLQAIDRLRNRIVRDGAIPTLLFDYRHPAVSSLEIIPGSIAPGTYTVQVTGFGENGSESLPSDPTTVTLLEPAGVRIRIPRVFPGDGIFTRYGVYVNGRQLGIVPQDAVSNTDWEITTLPAPDAAQPPVTSAVPFGPMRVYGVTTHTMQDVAGAHLGFVRFRTRLSVATPANVADKMGAIQFMTTFRRS
ncbi:MAG TPA: hypothetical protein VK464_04170 [Symbiobacteriaceae bacterium]|jgi:hypothetical protein|nr:hypothetical protein [Symbiobacteriaceae bacterium]